MVRAGVAPDPGRCSCSVWEAWSGTSARGLTGRPGTSSSGRTGSCKVGQAGRVSSRRMVSIFLQAAVCLDADSLVLVKAASTRAGVLGEFRCPWSRAASGRRLGWRGGRSRRCPGQLRRSTADRRVLRAPLGAVEGVELSPAAAVERRPWRRPGCLGQRGILQVAEVERRLEQRRTPAWRSALALSTSRARW